MGRTLLAIAAGFVLWTVLWLATNTILQNTFAQFYAPAGGAAPTLLLILLAVSVILSVVSGYTTAAIATAGPERHALYLGILLFLVGLFVQFQNRYLAPLWYHVLFLGLLIPAALLGGVAYTTRQSPSDDKQGTIDYQE